MVPCSLPVKFHEDHFYLIEAYRGFIGRIVAVQVSMSTMDRSQNLFSSKALITVIHQLKCLCDKPFKMSCF